ncbi:hypothetical protein D3C75_971790 [compost metagenome]
MMTTEQAPVCTLDLRRFSGGRHPQKPQRVLITWHTVAQWPLLRLIVVGQRLHLTGRPAQPFAPLADQLTFTAAGTTIGPDHSPAGAQHAFRRMGLGTQATQITAQAVIARFTTIERGNRPTLGRLGHFQRAHFRPGLLDVAIHHPPVALRQTSQ